MEAAVEAGLGADPGLAAEESGEKEGTVTPRGQSPRGPLGGQAQRSGQRQG